MHHVHFVGIGGIGMSGLAQLCKAKGYVVTGSDSSESVITRMLASKDIQTLVPQDEKNITKDIDVLVYSEAISESNPERVIAKTLNIPQRSYFEYLGQVTDEYKVIAVAGTHGKTTTTSFIGAGLGKCNFDATVLVGAQLSLFNDSNIHIGSENIFVVEACEYRNNFRFLNPDIVVLTSFEWDHPDAFSDEQSYIDAFAHFLQKAKTIITFPGVLPASLSEPLKDKIIYADIDLKTDMKMFGNHNQQNASLALTFAEKMAGVNEDIFLKGVSEFSGLKRRQEYIGDYNGVAVFDDYAHHPTEIKATLESFKENFPDKKIGVLYEPHQYSRTRLYFDDFVKELSKAETLGVLPIYEARDSDDDKNAVNSQKLSKHISNAEYLDSFHKIPTFIAQNLQKGDILLCMGAGDISEVIHRILE